VLTLILVCVIEMTDDGKTRRSVSLTDEDLENITFLEDKYGLSLRAIINEGVRSFYDKYNVSYELRE